MKDTVIFKKVGEIINKFFKVRKSDVKKDVRANLLNEFREASEELEILKNNYQFVSEDMIDYYVYQIKAAETKYKFLLKKLKKYDAV